MRFKKDCSDEDLLRGIMRSEVLCFEELFTRYYPRIVNFVTGIIKDHNRAEDIAMTIFMRLWTIRLAFEESCPVKNWLFVCARNAAIDFLRCKCNERPEPISADIKSDENLEDKVAANFMLEKLESSLSELPAQRSKIFIMSREEHLSNAEIADQLGLSVRTVEKHIQLALKDLREKLS